MISPISIILLCGFVFRLLLVGVGTLDLDFNTFVGWASRLNTIGFSDFYTSWSDYLPGYLYILSFLGKIDLLRVLPRELLFKLPAIIADTLTSFLIYKIVLSLKAKKEALFAAGLYLFNPALFANSALWGQVDSLVALFSILAIFYFSQNIYLSSIFLAVGTLIKPQAAFVAPLFFLLMWLKKIKIKKIISFWSVFAAVILVGFLPFRKEGSLLNFILERLSFSANQYPYGSINAFNFWGLFGFWQKDTVLGIGLGITFVLLVIWLGRSLLKKKEGVYSLTFLIFASSFLFLTRMHERHLLPSFAPLAVLTATNPFLLPAYFGFSLTYLLNLFYSYNWITRNFYEVFPRALVFLISLTNILLFFWATLSLFKKKELEVFLKGFFRKRKKVKISFPKISLSSSKIKLYLIAILLFSFLTRLYNLGNPPNEYFDEVYHAFTAQKMLEGDLKAWEWWNENPKGFAYEWTHPPLAKLIMAGGMGLFGENAFGWRIPGAILGTFLIYLIYLLAKEIFKDEAVGLLAAATFSLDGLGLVMSRIGMNDIYLVTFSLASLYFFLRDKNFLSALFFAFAISSKWSAVYLLPILFVSHFVFKKKVRANYLWFFLLTPLIYLASYLPMFMGGHGLDIFVGVQKQMWWYHTRLKATHAYTSPWWTWPFLLRPIYLYTSEEVGGMVARIYAMGNPLVFASGVMAFVYAFYEAFKKKAKKLGFLLFAYLFFFVPWAVSPRIMFLYHYLPALPFLSILIAFSLRKYPKLIPYFLGLSFLIFIYFYPHFAGLKVPLFLDKSYYLFGSWR